MNAKWVVNRSRPRRDGITRAGERPVFVITAIESAGWGTSVIARNRTFVTTGRVLDTRAELSGKSRPLVSALCHDKSQRYRVWTGDFPNDYRSAWRSDLDVTQYSRWALCQFEIWSISEAYSLDTGAHGCRLRAFA